MASEIPRRFSLDESKVDPALKNRIFSADGDSVVGFWDGESIQDLARELERIEEDVDPNYSGLPHHDQIPEDLRNEVEKDYPVWACDRTGYCLVKDRAVDIEHVDTVREHYKNRFGGVDQFKEKLRIEREQRAESLRLKK